MCSRRLVHRRSLTQCTVSIRACYVYIYTPDSFEVAFCFICLFLQWLNELLKPMLTKLFSPSITILSFPSLSFFSFKVFFFFAAFFDSCEKRKVQTCKTRNYCKGSNGFFDFYYFYCSHTCRSWLF